MVAVVAVVVAAAAAGRPPGRLPVGRPVGAQPEPRAAAWPPGPQPAARRGSALVAAWQRDSSVTARDCSSWCRRPSMRPHPARVRYRSALRPRRPGCRASVRWRWRLDRSARDRRRPGATRRCSTPSRPRRSSWAGRSARLRERTATASASDRGALRPIAPRPLRRPRRRRSRTRARRDPPWIQRWPRACRDDRARTAHRDRQSVLFQEPAPTRPRRRARRAMPPARAAPTTALQPKAPPGDHRWSRCEEPATVRAGHGASRLHGHGCRCRVRALGRSQIPPLICRFVGGRSEHRKWPDHSEQWVGH